MPQLKFIPNNFVNGNVGIGLSSIIGPTGPQGAFGGPQGPQGQIGPTGVGFTSISNASNNRILTAINSDSANAESNLTFDGSFLQVNGGSNFTNFISLGSSQTGTISFNNSSNTGIAFSSNIVPVSSNLELGSITNPWKSIYISTGTVFIGPTGSLLINSNGLISSDSGFATPFLQIGSINPGQGINIYENNNLLYFVNSLGNSGPVSVFNVSSNSIDNTYYSLPGNVGFGITGPQNKIDVLGNIKATNTISASNFTGTNLNISSIESINNTLNIATVDNKTNTINIGTSNSTQTVNLGTVGNGTTTINIGGVGDTVNVAGNLVYVNSTVTEISNPYFILNQSGTNINNTGIVVSQNGNTTGAYILVNSASNGWTTKAGTGETVNLNQDIGTGSSPSFNNLYLNTDTISLGTNSNAKTNSVGIGYQTLQASTGPYSVAIGYQTSQTNNYGGYSVSLGYKAGQTNQSQNTIAVGYESGFTNQSNYALSMGPQAGRTNQGAYSIALGYQTAYDNQNTSSIAIGNSAGRTTQGTNSIAIGNGAGYNNQGQYCIAIGTNSGNTNQANNSIVLNANNSNLNAATNGFFVYPIRNVSNSQIVQLNTSTNELTYSNNLTNLSNVSSTNFTGTNITTNKISFNDNGCVYFKTGSSTGCFIEGLNYNSTGYNHYVYYNNTTKELIQSSPNYFYSYSTGTQTIQTGSNSTTSFFQPVTFNVNNILYHTFEHTAGSSVFTGTFTSPVVLQFTYSLQIHSSSNQKETAAAVLYLDNAPATGSYRSCTVIDNAGEYCLTNTFLVQVSSGRHAIQLQAAATNTNVSIGGTPNILPPNNTYTSANLCCTRVI